jgi:hypothetical protein
VRRSANAHRSEIGNNFDESAETRGGMRGPKSEEPLRGGKSNGLNFYKSSYIFWQGLRCGFKTHRNPKRKL